MMHWGRDTLNHWEREMGYKILSWVISILFLWINHGEKGARLLKEYNKYDKEFLEAIEFHHNDKFSGNNKLLDIIRESDNKN